MEELDALEKKKTSRQPPEPHAPGTDNLPGSALGADVGEGLSAARTPLPEHLETPSNVKQKQKGRTAGSEARESKHRFYFINPNLLLDSREAASTL